MPLTTSNLSLAVRASRASQSRPHATRALIWDAQNTSSLLAAHALKASGWSIDWLGPQSSIWSVSSMIDGTRTLMGAHEPEEIGRALYSHPMGALFVHGDDQVRWLLHHWAQLPATLLRHLPSPKAFKIALSKHASMQLAEELGVPVVPTEACTSPLEVAAASRRLAPRGEVVIKGEGGSAGKRVVALRSGAQPDKRTWRRVTRSAPAVLVQRRLRGPRVIVTVVFERGIERAACAHEKVAAYPSDFGPTAFGITRRIEPVHDYAERMFKALRWHGLANIEFRQDRDDGRWYFMEINPRVPSSIGIQAKAGVDVVATWAAVCAGRGEEVSPGRGYREGVRYFWAVPALALAVTQPWRLPRWGLPGNWGAASDLELLDPPLRRRAMRLAMYLARHR